MSPQQHTSSNDVLGAPPGVPIEECHALYITRIVYVDGERGIVSFWRPSSVELELLQQGKPVRLSIAGMTHPPLAIGVDGDGVLVL